MNVAPFVPCSTGGSGGGSSSAAASTDAPAGFVDLFAAHVTAATDTAGSSDEDASGDATGDPSARDVLTLAALASRSAHATLPLLAPVVTTGTGTPTDADVADTAEPSELVVTRPVVTTTGPDPITDEVEAVLEGDVVSPVPLPDTPPTAEAAPQVGVGDEVAPMHAASAPPQGTGPTSPLVTGDLADGPQDGPAPVATGTTPPLDADGEPVATAPAVDDDAPPISATQADTGRARADGSVTSARGDGSLRVDSVAATSQPGTATSIPSRMEGATPSSAAQRVLDIVSQLEDAPPPRVIVIETGEMRVRVGLDAGTVRLTVLGHLDEAGEEILREAADALEAGGFGTELDRPASDGRGQPRDGDGDRTPRSAPTGPATARPAARTRSGLQL